MIVIVRLLSTILVIAFFHPLLANAQNQYASNEHEEHDNAFYELIESITGSHGHTLDEHAVEDLISTLQMRFHMEYEECLDQIYESVPHQHEYNETAFLEIAQRMLHFLTYGNCSVALDTDDLTFGNAPICRMEVNDVLRMLQVNYEIFSSQKCFNEITLLQHNCTNDNDDLLYMTLTNLHEGHCILPTSEELEDELFEHIGVENDVITEENFLRLLTDLQIGSSSSASHDDHEDHEDHDHDHERQKRSENHEEGHEHEDHEHDHDHETIHQEICYSDQQLRSVYGNFGNLSREQVINMCPVFLQQIVSGACSESANNEISIDPTYTTAMKYGYGTASVTIISLLAFVGMLFFPVISSTRFKLTMQFFIALGVGTMSGDAIFHILPDILGLHSHEAGSSHVHSEIPDYTWKLVVVVAAIWVLFIFENGLRVFSAHESLHNHAYSTSSSEDYENNAYNEDEQNNKRESKHRISQNSSGTSFAKEEMSEISSNQAQSDIKSESSTSNKKTYFWGITATGIMVFLGDVLHNFGDGIAIGAAFAFSWPQGVGTSLAIVFHELPHEFGDFAIYLNNGLSKFKALMMNFAAACCCFIGLYVALALAEDPGVRVWLLAFVAGMFLYVSFVNVLREMVEERTGHPKLQFALQNLGLVSGWTILLLLAIYEEQLINSIA